MKTELAIKRQIRALERRREGRPSMGPRERAAINSAIAALWWALKRNTAQPIVYVRQCQLDDMNAGGAK